MPVAAQKSAPPATQNRSNVAYEIDVRFEPAKKAFSGYERIMWKNTSANPVKELQFHLYLNAYRNSNSSFWGKLPRRTRRIVAAPGNAGWIDLDSLTISGGENLVSSVDYLAPDDGNPEDRTVIRLPLQTAVRPGRTIQIFCRFSAKLPQIVTNTGYLNDFFMVADWFPKLGQITDDGWICQQNLFNGGHDSDFGVYNVRITTPGRFVVAATGSQTMLTEQDTTKTIQFHAAEVLDFAWTADANYTINEEIFGNVTIQLLLQPYHDHLKKRYLDIIKTTLKHYAERYGPYPYAKLTVVDPPSTAGEITAMNYPTLLTVGAKYWQPEGIRFLEQHVIQQFGHQYWQDIVGFRDPQDAWLTSGLVTYSAMRTLEELYGAEASVIDYLGIYFSATDGQRAMFLSQLANNEEKVPARQYARYVGDVNARRAHTALAIATLENYLGKEVWSQAMRSFFEKWRFKHPTADDFLAQISTISDQIQRQYLADVLSSQKTLDYGIFSLESTKLKNSRPTTQINDSEITGNSHPDSITLSRMANDSLRGGKLFQIRIGAARMGSLVFPVEIRVGFEDGTTTTLNWDGRDSRKEFVLVHPSKAAFATVDPENKILLDIDRLNNSRTAKNQLGDDRLSLRWYFWIQNFLTMLASLAS